MKLVLVILLCIFLAVPTNTQTLLYNISTVVGGGSLIGDGLAATSAKLNSPIGIARSSSGEIYIVDTNNHRIRKISTSGIISTIAGTGTAGYSGDGLNATSAQLNSPIGIALTPSGEIYISDTNNHRIRKISIYGIISTIAGTGALGYNGDGLDATSAKLSSPLGIAISTSGETYIADSGNNRIRKISTNGIISTIAGNGTVGYSGDGLDATSAQLNGPFGVAISASGEIYISDTNNHRIRKISTNGIISIIAGTGALGYNGDGLDATNAQLQYPRGIAIISSGEIYITDSTNHRIRKISTNGIISTIVGTGIAGYNGDGLDATSTYLYGPRGVVISLSGEIYFSDTNNHRIRKISTSGIISTIAGTDNVGDSAAANLVYAEPIGPPTLNNGSLVFGDAIGQVRQVDLSTNIISTLANSLYSPTCAKYYGNDLYILYAKYYLEKINSTRTRIAGTGNRWGYGGDGLLATISRLNNPIAIAVGSSGEIYISDSSNHRIRKISTNGIISTIAGNGTAGYSGDGLNATSAKLNLPTGIAISSSGEIYFSDTNNHRIRKISTSGIISTIAGNGTAGYSGDGFNATNAKLQSPYEIAISTSGEIYISDTNNHRIRKISTSGIITTIAGTGTAGYSGDGLNATSAKLNSPFGIAISTSGEIYISDTNNHRIRKISTSGIITTIAGNGAAGYSGDSSPSTNARLNNPFGVAISSSGEIYISDTNNNRIRKISTSGIISTIAGNGAAIYNGDGLNATTAQIYQCGIAISSSDEIYIADTDNHRIRKISTSGIISTIAGGIGDGLMANTAYVIATMFEISSIGEIYIADTYNNRIRKISTNGIISTIAGTGTAGYNGDGSLATSAQLNGPFGVAISASDEIYIADSNNNRIRKISTNGIISTIAGNGTTGFSGDGSLATSAQLNGPFGVAISPNGEVYISDTKNNRIRKLDPWCSGDTIYVGGSCEHQCFEVTNKNTTVCSGKGSCIGFNNCSCLEGYYGNNCENFDCFNIHFNNSAVCSGQGKCLSPNNCTCENGYYGSNCEMHDCNNVPKSNSSVCSGRGNCTAPNTCTCSEPNKFGGPLCEIPKCNGTLSTSLSVCSSRGSCQSPNNCSCTNSYGGPNCEKPKCYGILQGDSNVCNFGNGTCTAPDTCSCKSGWTGSKCDIAICYSILANSSSVCTNKRGSCVSPNNCVCNSKYSGSECEFTTCSGIRSDQPSSVCFGNGQCIDYNTCNCTTGYGPSNVCQYPICYGYLANDTKVCNNSKGICSKPNICRPLDPICYGRSQNNSMVCSGNGKCIDLDYCECNLGFNGNECQNWECFGKNYTNSNVCNDGNGTCASVNNCICNSGWYGNECTVPMCSGILGNSSQVCNNRNGTCSKPGACQCNTGYTGSDCSIPICYDVLATNSSYVCSGRGVCIGSNKCNCNSGYFGSNCEITSCFGISKSNSSVCGGVGECSQLDTCICGNGYRGLICELAYISSSQATLQFNNSNEYVGESFTSMLTLNINNALFGQYYLRRSVKLVISFEINSQFSYSEILYIENGISSISLMVKSLNQIGTLKAHAQLIDNSTLISISDNIQSLNSITIQNRVITPTRSSSTITTKPITSPQSSRAIIDTEINVSAIAAGIIVPIAVIGIGSAIIAIIVTVVVLLKKKAAESAAKDIAQAQHVNVEML